MAAEILRMTGVTKKFPGVIALDNVNFSLVEGEIHGLIGANGAGKSTLIKTLAGAYIPDEGTIELCNKIEKFKNPNEAKKKGLSVIYQEFTLFPELDIARNIYFGMEMLYKNTNIINWNLVYSMAEKLIDQFDIGLNVRTKVKDLSVAQQQMVEIAKSLAGNAKILVMDEPTATLTIKEVEKLFKIIEDLKKKNVSIIYISHRIDEIIKICDRLTVLRNGMVVGGAVTAEVTKEQIIRMMIGDKIRGVMVENPVIDAENVLELKNVSNKFVKNISFTLKKGEVLGIAGLVGAGRTEAVRTIFGADNITSGEIYVNKKRQTISKPKDAIRNGIGFLPESRKSQGLFMNLNIRRNITFANLDQFVKGLFIKVKLEKEEAHKHIDALSIKAPFIEFPVANLSGGNQQKVVLAKWICMESEILILDEPTRGVDVGAKEEIFEVIKKLTQSGKAVIFISSELEEVLRVSNRILTMFDGKITAEFAQKEAIMDKIMYYITGGENIENN